MDFGWTEEQRTLREQIIRFAENELNDDVLERDRDGTFPVDAWRKCGAVGDPGPTRPRGVWWRRSGCPHDHGGPRSARLCLQRQWPDLLAQRSHVVVRHPPSDFRDTRSKSAGGCLDYPTVLLSACRP